MEKKPTKYSHSLLQHHSHVGGRCLMLLLWQYHHHGRHVFVFFGNACTERRELPCFDSIEIWHALKLKKHLLCSCNYDNLCTVSVLVSGQVWVWKSLRWYLKPHMSRSCCSWSWSGSDIKTILVIQCLLSSTLQNILSGNTYFLVYTDLK